MGTTKAPPIFGFVSHFRVRRSDVYQITGLKAWIMNPSVLSCSPCAFPIYSPCKSHQNRVCITFSSKRVRLGSNYASWCVDYEFVSLKFLTLRVSPLSELQTTPFRIFCLVSHFRVRASDVYQIIGLKAWIMNPSVLSCSHCAFPIYSACKSHQNRVCITFSSKRVRLVSNYASWCVDYEYISLKFLALRVPPLSEIQTTPLRIFYLISHFRVRGSD